MAKRKYKRTQSSRAALLAMTRKAFFSNMKLRRDLNAFDAFVLAIFRRWKEMGQESENVLNAIKRDAQ